MFFFSFFALQIRILKIDLFFAFGQVKIDLCKPLITPFIENGCWNNLHIAYLLSSHSVDHQMLFNIKWKPQSTSVHGHRWLCANNHRVIWFKRDTERLWIPPLTHCLLPGQKTDGFFSIQIVTRLTLPILCSVVKLVWSPSKNRTKYSLLENS